ncbi:Hypothetical protein GLP15_427 [Giardia lamblia P15]|uniref:Kelch repeat-containing protein n=1 Tax=Giardia intestinalis (strain P15) TaxID=658858 RepID=E1F064_GIAIA|nr:Hypothetical protein GLP15_427 [Giardia lamblia P15]
MRVLFSKVKRNLTNHLLSSQVVSIGDRHYGIKLYREGTASSIKLLLLEPTHEEVRITERPIRSMIDTSALSGLRLTPFNNLILISITYQRGHQLSRDLQFYLLDPDELNAVHLNLTGVNVPARNGYNLCQVNEAQFLVCGGVTVTASTNQPGTVSATPSSTVLADAYLVDLRSNSIIKAANLPYPLRRFSLTYIQNRVVLIGGSQYSQKTSSNMVIFEYLASSDQWHRLSLFKMRSDHTVAVFKSSYLLLFGGVDAGKLYADLWLFDLQENKWHSVTITGLAPSEGRCLSSLIFEQDFCYIISGCGTHKTIYLDSYRFSTMSLRNALGIHVEGGGQYEDTTRSLGASMAIDGAAAETVKQELLTVISSLKNKISTLQTDMESIVLENKQLKSRVFELESHMKTLEGSLSDSQLRGTKAQHANEQDMKATSNEEPYEDAVAEGKLHPRDLEVVDTEPRMSTISYAPLHLAPPLPDDKQDERLIDEPVPTPLTAPDHSASSDLMNEQDHQLSTRGPIEEPIPETEDAPHMEEIEIEGNSPQARMVREFDPNLGEPVHDEDHLMTLEEPIHEEDHDIAPEKSIEEEPIEESSHHDDEQNGQETPAEIEMEEESPREVLGDVASEHSQDLNSLDKLEEPSNDEPVEDRVEHDNDQQILTFNEPIQEYEHPVMLKEVPEEEQFSNPRDSNGVLEDQEEVQEHYSHEDSHADSLADKDMQEGEQEHHEASTKDEFPEEQVDEDPKLAEQLEESGHPEEESSKALENPSSPSSKVEDSDPRNEPVDQVEDEQLADETPEEHMESEPSGSHGSINQQPAEECGEEPLEEPPEEAPEDLPEEEPKEALEEQLEEALDEGQPVEEEEPLDDNDSNEAEGGLNEDTPDDETPDLGEELPDEDQGHDDPNDSADVPEHEELVAEDDNDAAIPDTLEGPVEEDQDEPLDDGPLEEEDGNDELLPGEEQLEDEALEEDDDMNASL